MPNPPTVSLLAACLTGALLTGCSRGRVLNPTDQPTRITAVEHPTAEVSATTVPPTSVTNSIPHTPPNSLRTPQAALSTLAAPETSEPKDRALGTFETGLLAVDGLNRIATSFVESLLTNHQSTAQSLADASYTNKTSVWLATFAEAPSNGRVLDALIITNAAGHAIVGVSVAFPTATDGTINEPIAYLVETVKTSNGWRIIGMGYA